MPSIRNATDAAERAVGSPNLTLVLIEVAGAPDTRACLDNLLTYDLPILAVLRSEPQWLADYPQVRFEVLALPVPLRRKRGVELAESEFVALVEDTGRLGAKLLQGIEQAFGDPACAAASGPVALEASLEPRYQALACTEYGRYQVEAVLGAGVRAAQSAQRLPGNLLVYRQSALRPLLARHPEGLIEGLVNAELLAAGSHLVISPELGVRYAGRDRHGARLKTRFQHGRIYGGGLAACMGLGGRFVHACKCLLLPLVLSARSLGHMSRNPAITRGASVALWILGFELCWSLGEFWGCLFGKPSDLEAWR